MARIVTITAPALAYSCKVRVRRLYCLNNWKLSVSRVHFKVLLAMSTASVSTPGLKASTRTADTYTNRKFCFACRPKFSVQHGLTPRREPCGPGAGKLALRTSCSAVVDRPQEADLQSADLGWPRGFPSRYVLGEQLGRGSFGTVYLATDRVSGQEVAAKIIPKERKGATRECIIDKIQQEVRLDVVMWLSISASCAMPIHQQCRV